MLKEHAARARVFPVFVKINLQSACENKWFTVYGLLVIGYWLLVIGYWLLKK